MRPAAFGEGLARFRRTLIDALEHLGVVGFGDHFHGAGEIDGALLHHLLHAGMGRIGGPEDVLALEFLVDCVLFSDLHGAHEGLGFSVPQRHFLADATDLA